MNKKELLNEFSYPSVAYRGKPFWSWNGELREKELVRQTKIMKEMGLGGYFMHSRAGLITEYLGEEWFDLINAVADSAEEDGMEAWLYDEDRWPSGSAGGKVTVDPQYRMKSLYVYESAPEKFEYKDDTISVYVAKIDGINLSVYKKVEISSKDNCIAEITAAIDGLKGSAEENSGEWKALRFAIVPDPCNSNYNGTTYIDTMSLKATERFIELTHEEYRKRCGDRLGRSIKGIFTDEPHRGHCFDNLTEVDGVRSCAVCWTDDIFEEFKKRYGYDAEAILPELFYRFEGRQVAQVKLHYIDLADHLFIERFAMPINEWCQRNGIIFTGHVLHEDSLMNQTVPQGSLMRFYEHMGYPGVDCLTEHNRCYWIVKQLSSAARQLGQKWLLSELYGCTGWQFDFKSHKAVGDWQALFGINLRCQHLSWYTMEGESKRDYPASILHQSPWYKEYKKVEDYFARFGLVMSEGEADCSVLLLNPIESLWCQAYLGWAKWISNCSPDVAPYEERYAKIFHMLADNQIDFDYGEEEMMSRLASVKVKDGKVLLCVGRAEYETVIVSNMLTVRPSTLDILSEFMEKGGKVIFAGELPAYVDAVASDRVARLAENENAVCVGFDEGELVGAVRQASSAYVSVINKDGESEKCVFAQVRRDFGDGGFAVVVLNTDRALGRKDLTLKLKTGGVCGQVQLWDLENGERYDMGKYSSFDGEYVSVAFDIEAAGTVCFVVSEAKESLPEYNKYETLKEETVEGRFDYSLDEKNVCVLDYVKWKLDGRSTDWSDEEEVLWADRHIRDLVGIERRGGAMLQPWYAKLNYTEVYGELHLSYEFYVDELPDGELYLAGERPELNRYRINGVALVNDDIDDFWVDDCFKRMRIPDNALKLGKNCVTIDTSFMRTTNVEAVYLIGDFGVELDENRKTLVGFPRDLGCRNYEDEGMPFYTGEVTYHLTPEMYKGILGEDGERAQRILITPKSFVGGCAKITALGKTTVLGWDPYEADITEAYRQNSPIDITVVGTRRNVFGPLHQTVKTAPACGPGNFVTGGKAWTDSYSLIDSGIRGIIFKAQIKK